MKRAFYALLMVLAAVAAYAANEISVSWTVTANKNNLSLTRQQAKSWTVNAALPNVSAYTVLVGTQAAGTAISPGYVSTNGWGWVVNTSTNSGAFIDIGTQVGGTFYPVARLYAGEGHPMRTAPGTTNYARAGTTTTNTPTAIPLECPIIDN